MNSSTLSTFSVLLVLLVATLQKTDAGCLSKEWIQYKEEKCIRVFDLLSNRSDAELTCREYNSTLLSITLIEEQQFLSNLLFAKIGAVDNVWLGADRVNSTTFQWTDGSPWTFDNWKEGSPSGIEENGCAQMVPKGGRQADNLNTLDPSPSGLWSDVVCGKRNLVVCQRRPTFSLDELNTLFLQHRQSSEAAIKDLKVQLTEEEKKMAKAESELKELDVKQTLTEKQLAEANSKILHVEKNPVPLGFVYTQLSGQPDPSVIWPMVKWSQVTKDYAGLFFRAEGGNSSAFGQIQGDQSPRLSRVVMNERHDNVYNPRDVSVPERGVSANIYVGSNDYSRNSPHVDRYFLSFHNSGGEVRPKNQAIRLWKRTA